MTHRVLDRSSSPEHRRRIDRARLVAELRHALGHDEIDPSRPRYRPENEAARSRARRVLGSEPLDAPAAPSAPGDGFGVGIPSPRGIIMGLPAVGG